MSERAEIPTPEGEFFESTRFAGLSLLLGLGAIVGLVLCLIGGIISPLQFSYSWLFGFIYFFTLCCGCLFWTIVHHATDAEWSNWSPVSYVARLKSYNDCGERRPTATA